MSTRRPTCVLTCDCKTFSFAKTSGLEVEPERLLSLRAASVHRAAVADMIV